MEFKTAHDRVKDAANKTTGEVLPAGQVNQYTPEEVVDQIGQPRKDRAKGNGVSRTTQQKLDGLARVRPDLLAEVQSGAKTANRAAIEAGIVRVPSLYEQAQKAVLKMAREDQEQLAEWIRAGSLHCQIVPVGT